MPLPEAFKEVLRTVNGLEYNGMVLYGIDSPYCKGTPRQKIPGLIQENREWYQNRWDRPYLFPGHSDLSWYVCDTEKKTYHELDLPSGTPMASYDDLNAMLDQMLQDSLR